MKKKTPLLLTFLLLTFFSFSQSSILNQEITIGTGHEVPTELYNSVGFKINKIQYAHLKITGKAIFLNIFDKNLKSIKEKKLNFQQANTKLRYQDYLIINEDFYLFTSLLNSSGTKSSLYQQKLNKERLTLGPAKKIADITHQPPAKKGIEYYLEYSPDQSKILITCENPDDQLEEKSFQFVVLDHSFKELWRKELSFPAPATSSLIHQHLIDNEGHVHLLNSRSSLVGLYQGFRMDYEILSFWDAANTPPQSYPIDLADLHLREMKIGFDAEQNIIGGGFFTNKLEAQAAITGAAFVQIQKSTQQLTFLQKQTFDTEFILQHLKPGAIKSGRKKVAKGKTVGIEGCLLRHAFFKEEGGLILIGEIQKSRPGDNTRNYDDIILVNASPQGQITWTQKIPKHQVTSSGHNRFYNYTPAFVKQHLYLLYNDYKGNTALEDFNDHVTYNHKNIAEIVLVDIDPKGQMNRKVVSPQTETRMILQAHDCMVLDDQEWLIYLDRKKERFLGKLVF